MPRLHLYLLGAPRLEREGQSLIVERRKVMALFIYLAVSGRAHTRTALATLLWPEADHSHAHGSLRRHLSELELLLGPKWIEANRQEVALRPNSGLWLDVAAFQQAIAACHQHGHSSQESCTACIAPLSQAAEIYQADFLTGFSLPDAPAFDEWAFFQAETLRRALTGLLQRLIEAHSEQQEVELAIPYAQRWVQIEPYEEVAHRRLMLLYARNQQQSAALRQYELCRQLLASELDVEPAAETNELYEQIRKGQLHKPQPSPTQLSAAAAPRHNLSSATTPFIGRTQELADLRRLLLDPAVRLVTILGIGGMGKSHLALEAARAHLDSSQERVSLVSLASLQSADEMVSAIAAAVGVVLQPERRALHKQLLDFMSDKQWLLLLDNLEHLPEAVPFVHELLQSAPGLHILATSRERLQLSEEVIFALGGMKIPSQEISELAHSDPLRLFMLAARRANPHFEATPAALPFVAAICRQVGGMPLGILLAAAWAELLSPQEISVELEQSVAILETQMRDLPERQRSIQAVLDHTWQRLAGVERSVLMKLSVFRGGFTRSTAERVAGATLPSLSILVNYSLIQREQNGRYSLHELLRQFAAKELAAAGLTESTLQEHSRYFISFLAERTADLKGPRQKEAMAEIEADFDNVRGAWQWACTHLQTSPIGEAMEALAMAYGWFGRYQEGERAFAQVVALLSEKGGADEQRLLTNVLIMQAHFCRQLGDDEQVRLLLRQSLALLSNAAVAGQERRQERAGLLKGLAVLAYHRGDRQEASALFAESRALYRQLADRWQEARLLLEMEAVHRNLHGLPNAQEHQRESQIARELVLESLAIFRELGDQAHVVNALQTLALTALTLGEPQQAHTYLQEALAICQELGLHDGSLANVMGDLGTAEEFLGNYSQMRRLGHALLEHAHVTGYWDSLRMAQRVNGIAALAEGDFVEADRWLEQNAALLRQRGINASLAYALASRGLTSYWRGETKIAQRQLAEAFRIAIDRGSIRPAVHGLLLAALLLTEKGESEGALELYALALTYPFVANSRWCHDTGGWRLAALAEELSPEVKAAVWQRGQARSIWATAEEQLAWLTLE